MLKNKPRLQSYFSELGPSTVTVLPGHAVETSAQRCEDQRVLLSVKLVSWSHGSVFSQSQWCQYKCELRETFLMAPMLNSGTRS